jgi:single-strand DNA-binding protein
MASVNKVILVGRLGKDPEKSGPAVKFSVATSEKWKDKSGESQERTEWTNVVTFGKLADICLQYLKKGSEAYIEGKLQTDKYEKDGVTKYSTSVIANTVQFLSKVQQQPTKDEFTFDSSTSDDSVPF